MSAPLLSSSSTPFDAVELGRSIAQDVAKRASKADLNGTFPPEDADLLKKSGYTALNISQEFGGLGWSMHDCLAAHLELAKGSTSTAIVAGMTMQVLGNERDSRRYPAEAFAEISNIAVSQGILINSVASEPKLGSPSRGGSFQTHAAQRGGEWLINGHKNWITGGANLSHMIVKLSTDDGNASLLVPSDTPGLRWEETWGEALSLRASDSHDLYFEDAAVPLDYLLEGKDPKKTGPNLWFPMVMSATYLGGALGARDAVVQYALDRVPTALGKPIATLPKIQRQIGEIDVQLSAAKQLLLSTATLIKGNETAEERAHIMPHIATAKEFATSAALFATEMILKIAGGASISPDLPFERFFRDVRAASMHPPSGDAAYELIGRAALENHSTGS